MRRDCSCLEGEGSGYTPNPPYLDTTCKTCKQVIEHTGANGGVNWIVKGSEGKFDTHRNKVSHLGFWECWCPEAPHVGHRHVPLDLVSEAAVLAAVAAIAQA